MVVDTVSLASSLPVVAQVLSLGFGARGEGEASEPLPPPGTVLL